MNLYVISQTVKKGFGTVNSAVVSAESVEEARRIFPIHWLDVIWSDTENKWVWGYDVGEEFVLRNNPPVSYDWCHISDVNVRYIGETKKAKGVIRTSFNDKMDD